MDGVRWEEVKGDTVWDRVGWRGGGGEERERVKQQYCISFHLH